MYGGICLKSWSLRNSLNLSFNSFWYNSWKIMAEAMRRNPVTVSKSVVDNESNIICFVSIFIVIARTNTP